MSAKHLLQFDQESLQELDDFALLCDQPYNYGNHDRWFNDFRGGYFGAINRMNGIIDSYKRLHSWFPVGRHLTSVETNLSNLFFNLDSCVECYVFMLNALGYCTSPADFKNITDAKELRDIRPSIILGNARANPPEQPLAGFIQIFPSVVSHWQANANLLNVVVEQHDVSKHRKQNFSGGEVNMVPPKGLFKALGLRDGDAATITLYPMKKILLEPDPKTPTSKKPQYKHEDLLILEDLVPDYVKFINETAALAVTDGRANISLNETQFRTTGSRHP